MTDNNIIQALIDCGETLYAKAVPSSGRIVFDPATGEFQGSRQESTFLPEEPVVSEEDWLASVPAQEVPKACDMDSQGCESCQ